MILTAAALAALCSGCRSDGGIGRSDSASGMRFSTKCIAMHTRDDVANTKKTVADAPGALRRSVAQSSKDLTDSYYIYLQNGQFR
jgi:hypothetical protein